MNKIFSALIFALFSFLSHAQHLVTVQNGTNVSFFTTIELAVSAANNGDTIYIPSGTWSINSLQIQKKLHIIGVGHNPDSAQASSISYITGSFILNAGASYGSISGLQINGNIKLASNGEPVVSYNILRNNINSAIFLGPNCTNWSISENISSNIIGSNNGSKATNNGFFNNIIYGTIYYFGNGNVFKNNLFLNWNYVINQRNIEYCLFENNIISDFDGTIDPFLNGEIRNCQFNNNLFVKNYTFPLIDNLGSNNLVNQAKSSIFVNQTGYLFSYVQDYHLKESCPGKNAGTDGTDIGIYGGTFPWKDGSLPSNPHIQFKQIANSTDQNGNLKINIKVKAQNN